MNKQTIKKGAKFGKLTAIEFSYKDKQFRVHWLFCCDCGNKKVLCVSNVKKGNTKSCGCLKSKHKMSNTVIYKLWHGIKQRCLNKNHQAYKYYGGRGITICPEWLIFENFYKDMGNKPIGLSINRIENDKGYCKSNCRWATRKEQADNRRKKYTLKKKLIHS